MDKALFLIKPDAVNCRQELAIRDFMIDKKVSLSQEKRLVLSELQAKILCKPHSNKVYFNELVDLLMSGASVAYIAEGHDIINKLHRVVGDFEPARANEGTLRQRFISGTYLFDGFNPIYNSVMFSENLDNVEREINIIYKEEKAKGG